jgi:hypothetical protein
MKKLIIILCLLPVMVTNAQVIDWNNFNEKVMNDVLFNKMSDFTKSEGLYSLISSSVGNQKIYRFIKKNNERLLLDNLDSEINCKVLRKYDAKTISRTNLVGNVGILDSISGTNVRTYQEIAGRCITDWMNSPSDAFFMIGWSQVGDATTCYNKTTKTVYLFFAFIE